MADWRDLGSGDPAPVMTFNSLTTVAIGEAMVELAPVGGGLYRRGIAGDTFNTAWHMAQALAGRARVGFVSRVGQDAISDAFVAELGADGLDVSGIGRDASRTMGLYLIELDGVERSFHYWRSTSAARLLASDTEMLTASMRGAGLIHLSGITVAILAPEDRARLIAALRVARAAGARVSFDPNIRPKLWSSVDEVRETIPRFLAVSDIALPSFDDEVAVWGDTSPEATLARFAAAGVSEVVVKNGAGVVAILSNGAVTHCPTPAVNGIIDTTGAGDAFNAGYLAARLLGHVPDQAVANGQVFAAEVIRHFGARIPKVSIPQLQSPA